MLILTCALTLTGCATITGAFPDATSATTPAAGARPAPDDLALPPVETTPPVIVPAIGATITTDVDQKAATDAGLLLWDTFDATGNYVSSVVFAKDQPLPEAVKAAVAARVTALHAASVATGIEGSTSTGEQGYSVEVINSGAASTAARIADMSGRKILLVTPSYGSLGGAPYRWNWHAAASPSAGYPNRAVKTNASRDKFVAGLQAWVAAQADPGAYDILIAD